MAGWNKCAQCGSPLSYFADDVLKHFCSETCCRLYKESSAPPRNQMQTIDATYYCKLHGMFTIRIVTGEPPKYIPCPTCLVPSPMSSFSITGQMAEDQITVVTIRKMRDLLMGRPTAPLLSSGAGVGGDSEDSEGGEPIDILKNAPAIVESVLALHEAKERGKMEAMIAELES